MIGRLRSGCCWTITTTWSPTALMSSGGCAGICAIRQRTRRIRELERELAMLVADYAPQLLAEVGCGPLTAAKLIGEIAGADRFATDAKLARTGGAAQILASTGTP